MLYYLQDHISKCIVAVSEDVYLLNNLRSGFIDGYIKTFENAGLAAFIKEQLDNGVEMGIFLDLGKPKVVSLKNFSVLREKLNLVRVRKPCYEELLRQQRTYLLSNKIGFNHGDEIYIQHALSNDRALEEYAELTGMTEEFARKELTLLSESVFRDNFRAFTIASMFKIKINKITTIEESSEMIETIKRTFLSAGIYD
jgi:hypothetical protein